MSLGTRLDLYRQIEKKQKRPLIVYVTSDRTQAGGSMAGDAVPELISQLAALPKNADNLDFLIISAGGDPTVAWRMVSLIRQRCKRFAVMLPQAAYSAATLLALGADEILMHPYGNLGPTDPQITKRQKQKDGIPEDIRFGSEDLAAFLNFAKDTVGLSDQRHLREVFMRFCDEVGPGAIGVAARSTQLSLSMGEKLLSLHMKTEADRQKARAIAQALNRGFFHHGYALSMNEAKELGLKVVKPDPKVENLMWSVHLDLADELESRTPFSPISVLKSTPHCAPLFGAVPHLEIPANLPQPVLQQLIQQTLQHVQVASIAPAPYRLIHAVMESTRLATRCVTSGSVFAVRLPNLQLQVSLVPEYSGWKTIASSTTVKSPAHPTMSTSQQDSTAAATSPQADVSQNLT